MVSIQLRLSCSWTNPLVQDIGGLDSASSSNAGTNSGASTGSANAGDDITPLPTQPQGEDDEDDDDRYQDCEDQQGNEAPIESGSNEETYPPAGTGADQASVSGANQGQPPSVNKEQPGSE